MRKQDKIIVWPVYFDSTRTRNEGRRLPKKFCVPSPKIGELKEAVRRIKLQHDVVLDVAHPKMPWIRSGMLLVVKKRSKNALLQRIATELLKVRNEAQLEKRKKSKKQ
jgi:signal recognition particle subunit SRP19